MKDVARTGRNVGVSIYEENLHCQMLIDIMSEGGSKYNFCAQAGIGERTFKKWLADKPVFQETYDEAQALQKVHFHNRLLDAMDNPGANVSAILAAAKIVGGISLNRTVTLKGYKKGGTFADHFNCLMQNLTEGHVDIPEAKAISDVLLVGVKIDENTAVKDEVRTIKQHLGIT